MEPSSSYIPGAGVIVVSAVSAGSSAISACARSVPEGNSDATMLEEGSSEASLLVGSSAASLLDGSSAAAVLGLLMPSAGGWLMGPLEKSSDS